MTAVASRNVTFVSHSDQAGRSDGVQIMVHRGYAYIGHTFSNGITIMDVRDPKRPRAVDGIGPHRIWYTGGRYAYASIHFAEFTDHILAIIDVSDPRKPEIAGRWWIPGMWRAGAETTTWSKGKRYALHHALVTGHLAY